MNNQIGELDYLIKNLKNNVSKYNCFPFFTKREKEEIGSFAIRNRINYFY